MPERTGGDVPVYFTTTSFPRSGSNWLASLLFDLPGVGGFHKDADRGVPMAAIEFLGDAGPGRVLDAAGVSRDAFARRLLDPRRAPALDLDPDGVESVRGMLAGLAIRASRQTAPGRLLPTSWFDYVLEGEPPFAGAPDAVGMPSRHLTVRDLEAALPGFRIVRLLRDPRDVLVSWFYYRLATLRPREAQQFALIEPRTRGVATRRGWKQRFAGSVMRRLAKYFTGPATEPERVIDLRYEQLLATPVDELGRLVEALGARATDAELEDVVAKHTFRKVTGGDGEQRQSVTRRGRSGDWRDYFDRELLRYLGPSFTRLVRDLGYESDDDWIVDVPTLADREFEFSRFRIRRSTCRAFAHYWDESETLRAQYPNPWAWNQEDSFYQWLRRCDEPPVREWLDVADRLHEHWAVDIEEPEEPELPR